MFATEDSEHDVHEFILHPKDFNVSLCGADMEEDLARRIASRSLLLAEGRDFTLASGQTSNRFCDLKPAMLDPHTSSRITDGLLDIITILEPDFVGGLELGAVPLVSQVVAAAGDRLQGGFVVRKTPKGRGGRATGNPAGIEGVPIAKGGRVVVLEDVATTGGSAVHAAEYIERTTACEVIAIITVIDRLEGAREATEFKGMTFHSLLTIEDLIQTGLQATRTEVS